MRTELVVPPAVQPGDRVAVVSPSSAAPARFPAVHELSMRRLREDLRLEPVEYPTTGRLDAAPADRAADLMAAFTDPSIWAVLATIGGDDQITVLRHLDAAAVAADPKPFFGYSDNSNLLNWLWWHGIVGYHGGSTMVHLGRAGGLHPVTVGSLRTALFSRGVDVELHPVETFGEDELDWGCLDDRQREPDMRPSPGWSWHNTERRVTGPTWGGNLEILQWTLAANRWMHPVEDYAGCVLLLETSEELPSAEEVFRILRNAGERGLLEQFPAVLVATAKATAIGVVRTTNQRTAYREQQQAAILRALDRYNPAAVAVFGIDFGHTDPQYVLPYGGQVTVDGPGRRVIVQY